VHVYTPPPPHRGVGLGCGSGKQKIYLEEDSGLEVGSLWDDIARLLPHSAENQRYHGQRPLALLERIIRMGSNEGDIVLDPFCGSGTTLVAAQANERRWIGCDLSGEACSIVATRLEKSFGLQ
jgi:DNA modification methylase